ncbi:MAG: DUF2085 domain-containing protein, partial [Anaerolineaceae bacterium]|nr:DUF2085 domain-containing protein [Anaerolineaceae bacterium]
MTAIKAFLRRFRLSHWLILLGVSAVLIAWLAISPPGLMGKADAVGYAVCHRIDERSFFFVDRQMPLCSRCTGTFTAALLSLIYFLSTGKRAAGLPPLKFTLIFAGFLVVFGIDGINSSLHLFPGFTGIYEPHNWLRLVTGS